MKNILLKNKWAYLALLILIMALVVCGLLLWKKTQPKINKDIDVELGYPPATKIDWISGKVLEKGGNWFYMDYNGIKTMVLLKDETKFVDKEKKEVQFNIDAINISDTISVLTIGNQVTITDDGIGNKVGYLQARQIFLGVMK